MFGHAAARSVSSAKVGQRTRLAHWYPGAITKLAVRWPQLFNAPNAAPTGPLCSCRFWAARLQRKQLCPGGPGDGGNTGVGDAALDGDGEELLHQLGCLAHDLHAELRHGFVLQNAGRGENASTLPTKGIHEGAVVELSDDERLELIFVEPVIELLAHGRRGALDQHGCTMKALREGAVELPRE